jgi:hypothetical protein
LTRDKHEWGVRFVHMLSALDVSKHRLARTVFWVALIVFGAFGVIAGMGVGPGLLIGALLMAAYDLKRHMHIPTLGYVLLIVAMPVLAFLILLAGWSRQTPR